MKLATNLKLNNLIIPFNTKVSFRGFRKFCLNSCHNSQFIMENEPAASVKLNISERLSKLVRPTNYRLLLDPNLKTGTFNGNIDIQVNVKDERNHLCLHSKFLDIKNVKVFQANEELTVSKYLELKHIEQILIYFDQIISPGNYRVVIDFSGDLTRNIVGFYMSRISENSTMVASKFQPTYTRQAFPCFDEPEFKATYDISLVKPPTHLALSNMNQISLVHDDEANKDTVTFATSVPMSSYLVCFVVCDFAHKQVEINARGVGKNFTMRCFAQKGETHKVDFAQDIGKRATEYYIKYYQVPFPLPKLDMIAIPDYQSGATEHWGLITYRETSFLIDEATASSANKISVANTIAHELAHMWFGNLVTVKWWDDLWLNEGFATYMQVKALDAIEPTWTMLDQFLTKTLHSVLTLDAKLSSHPIVQTVETPDQITAIFDAISYNKGSSILRMLEGFIGKESFRHAINDYLRKHEFGNAITRDLYESLQPYFLLYHPELSLSYIMDTWTKQMGYPLVTVSSSNEPYTYILTQTRFLLNPDAEYENDSAFGYRWFIPITYKTNKGINDVILWFPDTEKSVKLKLNPADKWVKINNDQVGYYRVNYPQVMWNTLLQQLKSQNKQLSISDRAHLLNDVFALAEAGSVSYNLALDMTTYLSVEREYVVWDTALTIFLDLAKNLKDPNDKQNLEKYILSLLRELYKTLSWNRSDTGVIKGLLRARILSAATRYRLPEAASTARLLFLQWLNSRGTGKWYEIEPDLRTFVYFYGMKNATMNEWEKLWNIYLAESDPHEKLKLRNALTAPENKDILNRLLARSWDESNVRGQDYLSVLSYMSDNVVGEPIVWDHVRKEWPRLVARFTLNSRYLGNLIPAITGGFNTPERLEEMEEFFAKYPEAGAGAQARQRALETVRNNVKWIQRNEDIVTEWLETKQE